MITIGRNILYLCRIWIVNYAKYEERVSITAGVCDRREKSVEVAEKGRWIQVQLGGHRRSLSLTA